MAERLVQRRKTRARSGQGAAVPTPRRARGPRKGQPKISEAQLHHSVAQLLDWLLLPPAFYTTFPAGWGKFSRAMAGQLKGSGLKPGMPDMLVFHNGTCVGIELKAPDGTVSPVQRETFTKLKEAGTSVFVCRDVDMVINALFNLGFPLREHTFQCLDENFIPPSTKKELRGKTFARPEPRGTENNVG